MTTQVAWNDGSGDKIYLSYSASEGNQTVTITSDANAGAARTKTVTFSATGVTPVTLTVNQEGNTPYIPLNYIQTDGTAYIDTGRNSANTISAELKVLVPSKTQCVVLGRGADPGSSQSTGSCILVECQTLSSDGVFRVTYSHRYKYLGSTNPSIEDSVANQTPFECKSRQKKGNQEISVLQAGETTWSSRTSTQNDNLASTGKLYLFRTNSSTPLQCPSGTRIYYCKIYSDYNYSTLVFDGIPCIYNGAYGLWDRVSDSFKGNANSSGSFTGQ